MKYGESKKDATYRTTGSASVGRYVRSKGFEDRPPRTPGALEEGADAIRSASCKRATESGLSIQ